MRRTPVLLCALAIACAARPSGDEPTAAPTAAATETTRGPVPSPTSSPPAETTAPETTASGSPIPTTQPGVQLPSGMADVVDDPADLTRISAGDLSPLVPPGSSVGRSAVLATPGDPIDRVAVGWTTGALAGRTGLIVWQRAEGEPAWRAVYAFTDPKGRGVFGVGIDQGELTGDAIPDLLTFEDVGGSGACGTYRVITSTAADATEILRRSVCDTQVQIAGGDLRVREAVFEPDDPHCCPSAFRTTVLRWNGNDWRTVSEEVSPVPNAG